MSGEREGKPARRPPGPRPTLTRAPRRDDDRGAGAPDSEVHGQIGFPVSAVRPPVADHGLALAGAVVAILVGIAVVKPWGSATEPGPPALPPLAARSVAPASGVPPTPRPTLDTSPEGVAGPTCLGPGAWRIASLEAWRDQDVRVWRAIEPTMAATGPLDPAIPTVPVVGSEIEALGWCAPAYGPGRPIGPGQVDAWLVRGGVVLELELRRVLPARGETHLAALYVPLARCPLDGPCTSPETGAVRQAWPSGRVVFRYADQGSGAVAWLGAEVTLYETDDRLGFSAGAARGASRTLPWRG